MSFAVKFVSLAAGCVVAVTLASVAAVAQQPITPAPLPHTKGSGIAPAYEGWYKNPDGTFTMAFGYFNRNHEQVLDIPVGPENRIEPGPADQGQPTHFGTRRHTGVFTVTVPADFGSGKVTWTITANGETNSVPGHLRPEWEIDALREVTSGNTPPVIKLESSGPTAQGPAGVKRSLQASVSTPATLDVWVTDDMVQRSGGGGGSQRPRLGVNWSKYRGPGRVVFGNEAPGLDESGKATTTASFSEPGDYVLRVLAWDSSGGQGLTMAGGFYCCWTNGYVNVRVSAGGSASR